MEGAKYRKIFGPFHKMFFIYAIVFSGQSPGYLEKSAIAILRMDGICELF